MGRPKIIPDLTGPSTRSGDKLKVKKISEARPSDAPHTRKKDYGYGATMPKPEKSKPVVPFYRKPDADFVRQKDKSLVQRLDDLDFRPVLKRFGTGDGSSNRIKKLQSEKALIALKLKNKEIQIKGAAFRELQEAYKKQEWPMRSARRSAPVKTTGKIFKGKLKKRGGLLGLGSMLVAAGMAAKKAYDESENKQ